MTKINQVRRIITWGGGILVGAILAIPSNLNAVELSTFCNNGTCTIDKPESEVTNYSPLSITNDITIQTKIDTFINRSTIKATRIDIKTDGNFITNFYNYGRIETTHIEGSLQTNQVGSNGGYRNIYNYGYISSYVYFSAQEFLNTNIINYGEMSGIARYDNNSYSFSKHITIDNRGVINLFQLKGSGKKIHFKQLGTLTLKNYAMRISESASKFNTFDGNAEDNSHLVVDNVTSVQFADANSKIFLDFGDDFSFNSPYKTDKLIVKANDGTNVLNVEFSRLATKTSLYKLTQSGDNFIVSIDAPNSEIGILHKSNVRTMNNFHTISNSMIYPRKAQNLTMKNYRNIADSALDSANHLKSYESFAYRNEAINRRIQRQNKRNYSRESLKAQNQKQSQNLTIDSANRTRESQNQTQNPHDYYFILTPFVNHNHFFESGRYNLSGFDYGFLTAFSAQVAESNSLGAHFMMSYGSLGDKKDKDLSIKSLNLNLGLNYKLDLIYDMFVKARGDFYYFLNQAKTLTIFEVIKPNNLGFGVSVSYGKDFDFKSGGMLGIEVGLDYKALQSSTISLHDNIYQKSLYHLLYADLGVSYSKYFGNFGLNAGLGIRGNITANKLAKSQIRISALDRNVDMVLDNDNFLGYANLSASYVLNAKNFNMEFSLAYYGNFGDKAISNAGGFEWRVLF